MGYTFFKMIMFPEIKYFDSVWQSRSRHYVYGWNHIAFYAQLQGRFSKDNLCRGSRDIFVLLDTNYTCQDMYPKRLIVDMYIEFMNVLFTP